MPRPRKITVSWSYPVLFDRRDGSCACEDRYGIYAVTRELRGREPELLYIGLTERSFARRMDEHQKRYEKNHRGFLVRYGEKKVRFGRVSFNDDGSVDRKLLLEDVETFFICRYAPLFNTSKAVHGAKVTYPNLVFENTGFRWKFDRENRMKEVLE